MMIGKRINKLFKSIFSLGQLGGEDGAEWTSEEFSLRVL